MHAVKEQDSNSMVGEWNHIVVYCSGGNDEWWFLLLLLLVGGFLMRGAAARPDGAKGEADLGMPYVGHGAYV